MSCVFCKIVNGEIPSEKVYEDDKCVAFKDLDPKAPVHILIIPREHIPSCDAVNDDNCAVIGHIFAVAAKLAQKQELKNGYRIVNNCGEDGGQSVQHLHFHMLGGRAMTWPPG